MRADPQAHAAYGDARLRSPARQITVAGSSIEPGPPAVHPSSNSRPENACHRAGFHAGLTCPAPVFHRFAGRDKGGISQDRYEANPGPCPGVTRRQLLPIQPMPGEMGSQFMGERTADPCLDWSSTMRQRAGHGILSAEGQSTGAVRCGQVPCSRPRMHDDGIGVHLHPVSVAGSISTSASGRSIPTRRRQDIRRSSGLPVPG